MKYNNHRILKVLLFERDFPVIVFFLIFTLFMPSLLPAHTRSESFSKWHIYESSEGRSEKDTDNKKSGPVGSSLYNYWVIGSDHIISRLDHLAFLVGLLLLCRRSRDVIILITGFTIGYSVTLGLGMFGIINPDPKTVDALISFTIAIIALENIGESTQTSGILGLGIGLAIGLLAFFGAYFLKSGPTSLTMAGLALFSLCYLSMSGRMGDKKAKLLLSFF